MLIDSFFRSEQEIALEKRHIFACFIRGAPCGSGIHRKHVTLIQLSYQVSIHHMANLHGTDGLDDLLRSVGHRVGRSEGEFGVSERLFAGLDVVAFEADDERQ